MRFWLTIPLFFLLLIPNGSAYDFGIQQGDHISYEVEKIATTIPLIDGEPQFPIQNETTKGTAELSVIEIGSTEIKSQTKFDMPVLYDSELNINFEANMTYPTIDGTAIAKVQGLDGNVCPDLPSSYYYYFVYPIDAMKNDCLLGAVIADQYRQSNQLDIDIAEKMDPSTYIFNTNGTSVRLSLSRLLKILDPNLDDLIPEKYNQLLVNYSYSAIIARENFTYGFLYSHTFIPEFNLSEIIDPSIPLFAGTYPPNSTFGILFDKETGLMKETFIQSGRIIMDIISGDYFLRETKIHIIQEGETAIVQNLELLKPTSPQRFSLSSPLLFLPIVLIAFLRKKKKSLLR
ncbi:MAG: hypothetical protein D6732_04840 [Methanobacteriota archaeon]|nr:MAG: hypothetical protein D6732_04840 [Euryarchaeota archaeon]